MSKTVEVKKPNNGAIIVCNIIMAAICVASIITLYIGTFWKIDLSVNINKKTLETIMGSGTTEESGGGSEIKAAEGTSTGDVDFMQYIDDDFELNVPISLALEGKTLTSSAFGQGDTEVKKMIDDEVSTVVDTLSSKVDVVIEVAMTAMVNYVAEEAKAAIKDSLSEAAGDTEIKAALEEKGITDEFIDNIVDEVGDSVTKLLDGDKDAVKNLLKSEEEGGSAGINKLISIYAEEEVNADSSIPEEQKAQKIQEKIDEFRNGVIEEYDEVVKNFADEDGNISSETIIVALLDGTGLMGESSEVSESQNSSIKAAEGESEKMTMDDVKALISEKILGLLNEETMGYISTAMTYVGYALLFIMATWAYLLLKIIIKMFCKNKTVSMAIPRIWGWMPHVFLVGLPMLVVKYLPMIIENVEMDAETLSTVQMIMDMISINVSSLTWVSAAGTAALMLISFFYHGMRKNAKRYVKENKQ